MLKDRIEAMKEQLKNGGQRVHVVHAPTFYPTPKDLAERMAGLLDMRPGHFVLEPSAGGGALLDAILPMYVGLQDEGGIFAIEQDLQLWQLLKKKYNYVKIYCDDFLDLGSVPEGQRIDRVIMNPPFNQAVDVKHIQRAYNLLAPGGRLVAICAAGSRQKKAFEDHYWEDLPAGTFKSAGTNVNTALVIMDKGQSHE